MIIDNLLIRFTYKDFFNCDYLNLRIFLGWIQIQCQNLQIQNYEKFVINKICKNT